MKIIISAYACDPMAGSEPGAGWAWTRAAAVSGHKVWLLTRSSNRSSLEAALKAEPDLLINPVYLDVPVRWRRWKKGQRGIRVYYCIWQVLARRRASELHEQIRFDVAHHLTFATDWLPAGVLRLKNVGSVWGPVGGAGSVPPSLYRYLGPRGIAQELLREGPVRLVRNLVGDRLARRVNVLVAMNNDVARRFSHVASFIATEPHVALSDNANDAGSSTQEQTRRTAIFVGRLVPWKGLALAIESLSYLPNDWTLKVIGAGSDGDRCQRLAERRNVSNRVVFMGHLPRSDVLVQVSTADVMLLPSMHDSAGWAIAEAIHAGTPVVSLDLGGPGTMLRRGGGELVPINRRVVQELAEKVLKASTASGLPSPWGRDRLPRLLDRYYSVAVQSANNRAEQGHR